MLVQCQAITWTNIDQYPWCHMASLGHNELNFSMRLMDTSHRSPERVRYEVFIMDLQSDLWFTFLDYMYAILCHIWPQSNQSNPVLLKERVRIPRTRRAGGAAMLWGALPLDVRRGRLLLTVLHRWSPRHSWLYQDSIVSYNHHHSVWKLFYRH